jgi:hypothetical protein
VTLSVVIVIASDTVRRPAQVGHLRRCLQGLREQIDAPPLEVIVPHLPEVSGLEDLARDFPSVHFVEVSDLPRLPRAPYRDHHDDLRTRGVGAATGPLVAMLEDHEVPDSRWAAGIVAAHAASSHAAIGGAVENAVDRPLNHAVCLCDFAHYLNPVPSGPSEVASDVNVAYKREALDAVLEAWRDRFNERRVHAALLAAGHTLALSPRIVVYQRRVGLGLEEAIVERFTWGRSYAATRAEGWGTGRRVLYAAGAAALPVLLPARIVRTLIERRRLSAATLPALPWVFLLSAAWALGECAGYAARRGARVMFRREAGVETVRTS